MTKREKQYHFNRNASKYILKDYRMRIRTVKDIDGNELKPWDDMDTVNARLASRGLSLTMFFNPVKQVTND